MQTPGYFRQFLPIFRLVTLIWVGYFLLLGLIDRFVILQRPLPITYYLVYTICALLLLLLAYLPVWQRCLGSLYPVLCLGILALLPIGIESLFGKALPWQPWGSLVSGSVVLRHLPLLLLPVLITAWFWREWHVLVMVLWITIFDLLGNLLSAPAGLERALVTMILVRGAVFFGIGYLTNQLIRQMVRQQLALESANQQLVELATQLEQLTISRERNRMARELHDTLAHSLSGMSVQLEAVKAYWDVDPTSARRVLDQSLETVRSGLQETRRALKSLRAAPLEDLGLLFSLRMLAESAAQRADLTLSLTLDDSLPALSNSVEQSLYRVAQEAISNVVYHANARTLTVQLTRLDQALVLRVQDDGSGMETDQAVRPGHFGIVGIYERASLLGGRITLDSVCGVGTTLLFTLPLE